MSSGPALIFGSQVFPIVGARALVGRGDRASGHIPDIDLEPRDGEHVISRKHAEIEYQAGIAIITDLGSRNGTYVNEERLAPQESRQLEDADSVRFGHIGCSFVVSHAWPDNVPTPMAEETFAASSMMVKALKGLTDTDAAKPVDNWKEQVQRIQNVIDDGLITMVFQPIVELATGKAAGVESLARLNIEPKRGPDLWFEEAEKVGLGVEMEMTAIRGALSQLELLPPNVYMSINAGPATATSKALRQALDGLPLPRLVLEVTEHDAVSDYQKLMEALDGLRSEGLRLAVDDMGSGYANLKHLLALAPEIIKFDNEMVSGIDTDTKKRALAGSFANFAHEIGAKIVAEGVETASEYKLLQELGVQLGQGYFMARPGPLPVPKKLISRR